MTEEDWKGLRRHFGEFDTPYTISGSQVQLRYYLSAILGREVSQAEFEEVWETTHGFTRWPEEAQEPARVHPLSPFEQALADILLPGLKETIERDNALMGYFNKRG